MYDTKLPEIFLVIHGVGTVLGKAQYSNYFVVYQGCTIGSNHGKYPVLGRGLGLGANAAIIGACRVGDDVSIGMGTAVIGRDRSLAAEYFSESGLRGGDSF
jgi:serine O-acetyltransferase